MSSFLFFWLRTNFASKKMEEEEEKEEGQRTVECLRGRLLAERQVSRSAKEEAELITRKVTLIKSYLSLILFKNIRV